MLEWLVRLLNVRSDVAWSTKPILIYPPESLLSVDVGGLSCGQHHVVVVGSEGEVYSWGKGEGGRLGQGTEEDWSVTVSLIFN